MRFWHETPPEKNRRKFFANLSALRVASAPMSRSFSSLDLVSLPRVDSRGGIALASAVEAAAAAQSKAPAHVMDVVVQIGSDKQALQAALDSGPQAGPTVREADQHVDIGVTGVHGILTGWTKFRGVLPEGQVAQELLDRLYGDGLAFVNYKVERQWAVVDGMLKIIDNEALGAKFAMLGATPALDFLKQAQATYGAVIGTTEALPERPEVGVRRDALLDSLRLYVVRVAGLVERGKPETEELAHALLKPIVEWRGTKSAGAGGA